MPRRGVQFWLIISSISFHHRITKLYHVRYFLRTRAFSLAGEKEGERRTSYRRRSIDKLQRGMKEKAAREGPMHVADCRSPMSQQLTLLIVAYSVFFFNRVPLEPFYSPWKIARRKARGQEQNSKGFVRPLAECRHFARAFLSTYVRV